MVTDLAHIVTQVPWALKGTRRRSMLFAFACAGGTANLLRWRAIPKLVFGNRQCNWAAASL